MAKYTALIRKEPGTDYWIDVPDIPGCVSSGVTIEAAKANFREAIEMHVASLRGAGKALPVPRPREAVLAAQTDPYLQAYTLSL